MIGAAVAPIAIVGIGCRFPGARGPRELWHLLREGRNAVREVPEHRRLLGFNIDEVYDPRPGIPGKISSRRAGFLDHPERFDPQAFGLSPRDAIGMEPQQRLACEVVWDALEDAGIPVESLMRERVSVMFGHMAEDYSREQIAVLGEDRFRRNMDVWAAGGIARAVLSGRISFLLGVRGPSFTVDTACSSSLLTVHLACQSLWSGEVHLAIAGGVNAFITPEGMIALSRVGMLSPDGCCKAFDDGANGFVRAEGAGAVILKPLEAAIAAGDPIYAVIRGTGFSADGRDGGHMMAPGREGQAQAMRDAYERAGIAPSEVHFVETHGTGTVIGDPVEVGALADVMGPGRAADRPLLISSIKGNIGHCESASGIAGLIKAALCVFHRELPAQLHFRTPSRAIPWHQVPIRVQSELGPWPYPERALAGVNSFGISGTNAHIVLEQAPAQGLREALASAPSEPRPLLVPLSAHSEAALAELAIALRDALAQAGRAAPGPGPAGPAGDSQALGDLAYTLARRRSHRTQRLAIVARTREELAVELERFAAGALSPAGRSGVASPGKTPGVVFAFSGHGGHWAGMGRVLLAREPVFRAAIEEWDREQAKHVDWSLAEQIERAVGGAALERIDVLQPALTGIAIALARLFAHWGIEPCAVLGHSGGEIAAARVAGCLELRDAARIACARGQVVRELAPPGAMALVALPADALAEDLALASGRIDIAGSNSPTLTIVSGDSLAVDALVERLTQRGAFARRLKVEFASHSPQMDALEPELARRLEGIRPRAGRVPFHSTVYASPLEGSALDAKYWGRNLRAPVRFAETAAGLISGGAELFLEISPHPVLGMAVEEIARAAGRRVQVATSLRRDADDQVELLASLGGLFAAGCCVDFEVLHPAGRVVPTPLYPYQRQEYWFGAKRGLEGRRGAHPFVGLLGANAARIDSALEPGTSFWQLDLARDALGPEPRGAGAARIGFAELAAIALAQGAELWPGSALALREIEWAGPLELTKDGARTLQLARACGARTAELAFASRPAGSSLAWRTHLRARVAKLAAPLRARSAANAEWRVQDGESEAGDAFYAALEASGVAVPRERRGVQEACFAGRESAARVLLPEARGAALDARALAAGLELLIRSATRCEGTSARFEFAAIGELRAAALEAGSELQLRASLHAPEVGSDPEVLGGALWLARSDGTPLGELSGLCLRRLRPARRRQVPAEGRRFAARAADPARLIGAELCEMPPRTPGADEVEIQVAAAGLSFLDVLHTLGLEADPSAVGLGCECAGVVTAVGAQVRELAVGDAVLGFARGAIATHVVTPAAHLVKKPAWLGFTDAAAWPLARGVAEYALRGIARLRAGERIALHSAAGAIGQSAIALARELGAEVVASAGSERKRAQLRACGAALAFDSRSPEIAEEITRALGARAVDVVLDLAGDGALLDLLAPGGRYLAIERSGAVELGAALRARSRRNLSFHPLDPLGLLASKPDELVSALRTALARSEPGAGGSAAVTVFPISQLPRALRYMAQARQLGKVVLSFEHASAARIMPLASPADAAEDAAEAQLLEAGGAPAGADASARFARLAPEACRAALRELTGNALAVVLRLAPADRARIDWQRPLGELGLDSLMGVELGVRLREAVGVELQPAALFGLPNLEAVVARLAEAVAEAAKEAR